MNVNIHINTCCTGIIHAGFHTSCYASLLGRSLGLGWHPVRHFLTRAVGQWTSGSNWPAVGKNLSTEYQAIHTQTCLQTQQSGQDTFAIIRTT